MKTSGLIDLQVNGYAGVDFNDAALTPDALDHALHTMVRSGVTACLPTLITADHATLGDRLAALDSAVAASRFGPLMVPGFHLEGPFLNPSPGYAGCHPAASMLAPNPAVIEELTARLRRPILLLTLAPERDGAFAFIAWARGRGIIVAMGHTAADTAIVSQAVQAGVAFSTHLGNALPQPQPKFLNPLIAQLAHDELHASFIADGIHIPPEALKVLLRAKGLPRSVLVTDATAAAATKPGLYPFAGMTVQYMDDGSVRIPGSASLAGSALCLDAAVRNVVAWGLADPPAALAMASAQPAALLAPALRWHGITLPTASVTWTAGLRPIRVRLGDQQIPLGQKPFIH